MSSRARRNYCWLARVRFSALLAVAMINAALGVISNWLGLWDLQNLKRWSLGESAIAKINETRTVTCWNMRGFLLPEIVDLHFGAMTF
jgi:hypothetical protein